MDFSMERSSEVVQIKLFGDLWGGWETFKIKDEVSRQLADGKPRVLVDLNGRHLNSAGIGVLVAILVSVNNAKAELKLCGLCERAERALTVAGVRTLFDVQQTRSDALRTWGVKVAA